MDQTLSHHHKIVKTNDFAGSLINLVFPNHIITKTTNAEGIESFSRFNPGADKGGGVSGIIYNSTARGPKFLASNIHHLRTHLGIIHKPIEESRLANFIQMQGKQLNDVAHKGLWIALQPLIKSKMRDSSNVSFTVSHEGDFGPRVQRSQYV